MGASAFAESFHQADRALPLPVRVGGVQPVLEAAHRLGKGAHIASQAQFRGKSHEDQQVFLSVGRGH